MNFQRAFLLQKLVHHSLSFQHMRNASKFVPLTHRGVFEVTGRDSAKLLQGLITNDITLISEDDEKIMHTYILNIQGRIVNDVFVHKNTTNDESFFLDCDTGQVNGLSAHLKRYKLRSKVKFIPRQDLNVLTLFDTEKEPGDHITPDPRNKSLGSRFLSDNMDSVLASIDPLPEKLSTDHYKTHRYGLGISEGFDEVDNGIPLEYNGALLNSISFTKGCYVGQELVARAHFTGVIRKRIMPLHIDNSLNFNELTDKTVYNSKGKRAGKLLGAIDNVGLGLMRIKEAIGGKDLHLKMPDSEIRVEAKIPDWWPDDIVE